MSISYIIPTYNVSENDLIECLTSIQTDITKSQFQLPIEILVCDDGSSDINAEKYRHICDEFPTSLNVQFLRSKNNKGLGANLNSGISVARGDYIFRLDPDDRNIVGRTKKQFNCLKRDNYDFSATAVKIVNSKDQILFNSIKPMTSRLFCKHNCQFGSPFFHSTLAFKKNVFNRFNYPERGSNLDRIEDLFLIWELLSANYRFNVVRSECVIYRDHELGLSKSIPVAINGQKDFFLKHYYRSPRLTLRNIDFKFVVDLVTNKRPWFLLRSLLQTKNSTI